MNAFDKFATAAAACRDRYGLAAPVAQSIRARHAVPLQDARDLWQHPLRWHPHARREVAAALRVALNLPPRSAQ